MSAPTAVAAIVVTYFPDAALFDRLDAVRAQVDHLMIVDNGSDAVAVAGLSRYAEGRAVTVVANGANLGIAAALNEGMRLLGAKGYAWVLTMDQDSTLAPGGIAALLGKAGPDIALVGANRIDTSVGAAAHRWLRPKRGLPGYQRVPCQDIGPDGVTLVITSGTLTSVAAFEKLGPFREDFFIDMVDSEYCLRARRAGYRVLVACEARLEHRVGTKSTVTVAGIAMGPTHHGPLRRYYLFRNAVATMRENSRAFPHWLVYELLALAEVLAGIVLLEQNKAAKLRACALGAWDGVRGRLGPATRQLS